MYDSEDYIDLTERTVCFNAELACLGSAWDVFGYCPLSQPQL